MMIGGRACAALFFGRLLDPQHGAAHSPEPEHNHAPPDCGWRTRRPNNGHKDARPSFEILAGLMKSVRSPLGFLPSLVPMFETQNLLDVQLVITSAAVLRDLVDQHRDLGNWRIHPVE